MISSFSKKGFTLPEVIIAASILLAGIVVFSIVFTRIVSLLPLISFKFTAAYLAQEGVEIVRNIRDTNWLEGESWKNGLTVCSASEGNFCEVDYDDTELTPKDQSSQLSYLETTDGAFFAYNQGVTETRFKRKIIIEEIIGKEALDVTVFVEWEVKGKPYEIQVNEHLYNWF